MSTRNQSAGGATNGDAQLSQEAKKGPPRPVIIGGGIGLVVLVALVIAVLAGSKSRKRQEPGTVHRDIERLSEELALLAEQVEALALNRVSSALREDLRNGSSTLVEPLVF